MPYGGEVTPRGPKGTYTPPRSIRVPDPLWSKVQAEADRRGETVTAATIRFYERYVNGED